MADITDIREAIAENLASISVPEWGDFQISAWMLAQPTPPCIHVFPAGTDYDLTMQRGGDTLHFTVQAFVPFGPDQGMQRNLDKFIATSGATSVKAALQSDPSLGGIVDDLIVRSCSGYRQYVFEGRPPCLGAEWAVDVITT